MQTNIYNFWKNNSLANIKPNIGQEFPEGWNVVEYFKDLYTKEDYGKIIEIGCGYGRLCNAFDFNNYLGLDISPEAIKLAKTLNPNYKFEIIEEKNINKLYPPSKTKLLYTVLLHQTDEDLPYIIENLALTSERIIVAEICGRDWRRNGNPPVFNRNIEEYDFHFRQLSNKKLSSLIKIPYKRYKNYNKIDTNLSIMVFEN